MPHVAAPVSKTVARPAPRPGPRPGYTRDEIVECALHLMDREGPSALAFRAVARELGVTVGALSRYFASLADLKDAVAAKIVETIKPVRPGAKRELRERLADFGMDIFRVTRAHPYLADIHGPVSAAAIARTMRQSIEVMLAAGVELPRALTVYSVVSNLAQAWGTRNAVVRTPAQDAAIKAAIAGELGKLDSALKKLVPKSLFAAERGWFLLVVDGLLK